MSWKEKYQNFLGLLFDLELRVRYTLLTCRLTLRIGLIVLRWRLSRGFRNSFDSNQPQTEVTASENVDVRPVRIFFYEAEEVNADGPMAVVRYTGYDDNGIPLIVRQLSYDDTEEGFAELERDVAAAIDGEVDTVIFSYREPRDFPIIATYLAMEDALDGDCDSVSE